MADVELVIKMPEEDYRTIKNGSVVGDLTIPYVFDAIRNSKRLPKGHGDLVDRDEINDRFYSIWRELKSYSNKPSQKELLDKWSMCMDDATPIIEADKEE